MSDPENLARLGVVAESWRRGSRWNRWVAFGFNAIILALTFAAVN